MNTYLPNQWIFVDESCVLHTDGTLSLVAKIDGYDIYMTENDKGSAFTTSISNLINDLPLNMSIEFHWRRRRDYESPKQYRDLEISRAAHLLKPLRESYISHIEDQCYANSVYLLVQLHTFLGTPKLTDFFATKASPKSSGGPSGHSSFLSSISTAINPWKTAKLFNKALTNAQVLQEYCQKISSRVQGCRLLNKQETMNFLYESVHHRSCQLLANEDYSLQYLLAPTGEVRNDLYVMNGTNVKPGMIYFYPEPNIRLFTDLFSWLPIEIDVAFYLKRLNYSSLLRKSGAEEVRQERQVAAADAEGEKRFEEISAWRRHVVNNNLQIFANVLFFRIFGDRDEIAHYMNEISENLAALGGVMETERLMNFSLLYSIPGNMYRSKFIRHDHSEMVMCLVPAAEFYQGNGYQEAFLASNHTFVGFDLNNKSGGEFYHSMTIAKTGSGKGVLNCARIIQLYGFGYDFYTIEIGNTYEFLFKLLGGDYVTLDPDTSVINPFPNYTDVAGSISNSLVAPTIKSMASIFTDGSPILNIHQIAVCEMTLKKLYMKTTLNKKSAGLEKGKAHQKSQGKPDKKSPNLHDFYECMLSLDDEDLEFLSPDQIQDQTQDQVQNQFQKRLRDNAKSANTSKMNDMQKRARDEILTNIKSFMDTIIGERFKTDTNLSISPGIFGADFKRLKDDSGLMIIYLTFLALRFGQNALLQQTPSFITIDELHEFVRIDKETIRTLCSQIARMGRKERGYLNLITQEAEDINRLDPSLINQMFIVNLLYTESGHQKFAERLSSLNQEALQTWHSYTQNHTNYRPAMIGYGDRWTDAFLSFPKEIMAIADTSTKGMIVKNSILRESDNLEMAYDKLLAHYEA